MNRADRITFMIKALTTSAKDDHGVVHFEDIGQQEHWVRVWNFGHGRSTRLEVTNRAIPGSPLPPLTRKQIDCLVELGVGPEARRNFEGDVPDTDAPSLAQRIERIFETLRSDDNFEMAAAFGQGEPPIPDPNLVDIYSGNDRAPNWVEEGWGDVEILERIKDAQSRYRKAAGDVSEVEPPYVITCLNFDGEYHLFADETAIMLRTISLAMQDKKLTGEQARDAYRPYARFRPEIYAPDYEEWNDWGFPMCTDDMDELSDTIMTREADAAGIPGVRVPWDDLHPMSGEPLHVSGEEALDLLRAHFRERYVIVDAEGEEWWELPPDEAQRRIETARARWR